MAATIEDFNARMKARADSKAEPDVNHVMLEQAAVAAANLTGDPVWDKYLSYIQAKIDVLEQAAKDWQTKCVTAMDDPAVRTCQVQHAYVKGMFDGFKECIELPAQLHAVGKVILQ